MDRLPFPLTAAQRRAVDEISADLAGPLPMHRLLQGDVGSGKTVVALCALLVAVQGGHQGALMAPTEVLAEQHFLGVRELLADLVVPDASRLGGSRPLAVSLLTNRTPAGERARLHEGLRAGAVDIVVGTHALLTDEVRFSSLGVVVIDEQHRFGVEQRNALRAKGRDAAHGEGADPDLLVMTATPIPRTAAMVVLRRPGRHRARRAPGRPVAGAHDVGAHRSRRGSGAGRWCATRWRRATAPMWCARWWRDPSASRPSRPPRSGPGWSRRCWPACASGCCTAS